MTKALRKSGHTPNPYVLAVLTAVLAATSAIVGSYFAAEWQVERFTVEYQMNMRRSAYTSFLEQVGRDKSPALSEFLNIGSMDQNVATDGQIQEFEDALHKLLQDNRVIDLYWQLNSGFKIVRLNGSAEIQAQADDILKVLALQHADIDVSRYPDSLQLYYSTLLESEKTGVAYGWDERVTEDERISLLLASRLFDNLVDTMRQELDLHHK